MTLLSPLDSYYEKSKRVESVVRSITAEFRSSQSTINAEGFDGEEYKITIYASDGETEIFSPSSCSTHDFDDFDTAMLWLAERASKGTRRFLEQLERSGDHARAALAAAEATINELADQAPDNG